MVLLPQAEQQIIQSYVCYVGEGRKEVAFFFPSQTEILLKDIFTVFFCVFVCWVFFQLVFGICLFVYKFVLNYDQ